jgi:hypothetical protein
MRATDDVHCRSVTLWQSGIFDRLQPEVDTAVVACARDGDGWAILMHDLASGEIPELGYVEQAENDRMLWTLAVIHARCWDWAELHRPDLGLATLPTLLRATTPSAHALAKYQVGYERLPDLFAADVARTLQDLIRHPQPLYAAMLRFPRTLVHGDFKPKNLMWHDRRGGQFAILDWQLAAHELCTLDLGWYLTTVHGAHSEAYSDSYRHYLQHWLPDAFSDREWQVMLDVGLLGGLLRCCCEKAWRTFCVTDPEYNAHTQRMIPHWTQWVRNAVQWL